ncbi:MAG: exodeoxyribonuclease V subunit alpha [Desulfotalea sp.]
MSVLLEKHLANFLYKLSGLAADQKDYFTDIIGRLIVKQDNGSSCLSLKKEEISFLLNTEIVSRSEEGRQTPLIVFVDKLYFERYYNYESRMARQLKKFSQIGGKLDVAKELIELAFANDGKELSDQRRAAEKAILDPFVLVSGGPGTGKTTTALKILSLLHAGMGKMDLALAAPTGKAAQRLYSSMITGIEHLPSPLKEQVDSWLPKNAMTIHRLLGVKKNSIHFRHNNQNPLAWDMILVDEASMVDIAMMSKLIDALKPGGRLILLGDKDQLASVESGTVLATLIASLDNGVELKKTYRFNEEIKAVATAIKDAKVDEAWSLLEKYTNDNWQKYILESFRRYIENITKAETCAAQDAFIELKKFMVLAALRNGRFGVSGINELVEKNLQSLGHKDHTPWYHGRPILILKNDYKLGLYNGDIGICLQTEDGLLRVFFEGENKYKSYLPASLCKHETVFAMTVHKSQGSEFNEVVLVLPEKDSQVLSRELIYTGITRAKEKVSIVADREVFSAALERTNIRESGLYQMIKDEF